MAPYLVDSNFFIQASRAYYPLDVAPGFWEKVQQLASDGKIASIDKVRDELSKNKDDLQFWIDANLNDDFWKDTSTVLHEYGLVAAWAASKSTHYKPKAINEFLDAAEADAWLIAYALKHKLTIVTYEVSAPDGKSKVKIPDVCDQFKVLHVNTIQMLRNLGEKF